MTIGTTSGWILLAIAIVCLALNRLSTRHWHLIGRHRHPGWHGHCDPTKSGYKPCGEMHWHFLWRHEHTENGR